MSFLWLCLLAPFLSSQRERGRERERERESRRERKEDIKRVGWRKYERKREVGRETEGEANVDCLERGDGRRQAGRILLHRTQRQPVTGPVGMMGSGKSSRGMTRPCHFYFNPIPKLLSALYPPSKRGAMTTCHAHPAQQSISAFCDSVKTRGPLLLTPLTDGSLPSWCHLSPKCRPHLCNATLIIFGVCAPLEEGGVLINHR